MKNNTQTGLFLVMIGLIIGMISTLLLFLVGFTTEVTDIKNIYSAILPALIPTIIGGLLILIGVVLMIAGRRDYGEKHSNFVIYAIIIFVANIIFGVIIGLIESFIAYTSVSNSFIGQTPSYDPTNILLIMVFQVIVSAILGGLIYVFLLFNLENNTGRFILSVAFLTTVIFAFIIAIYNFFTLKELLISVFSETTSHENIVSYIPNLSKVSIFGIVGTIMFVIATYIPYKRINSGDLTPVLPSYLKRCMNCGRTVPADSLVCAYCGKSFNEIR